MNTQALAKNLTAEESDRRLIGWLISFGIDELGFTYEIRSGRSFISNKAATDIRILTVADETISEPHLALRASARHKVMVQDIFSDNGSYLTRAGTDKENPITGPVEIKHGDWIRIGDHTRFQVCLLDGPSK